MCGLAGLVSWGDLVDGTGVAAVGRMLDAIAHRGPDGRGIRAVGQDACLGAVRLAIVDPAGSDQPLTDHQTDVHLVFNGEIYNHRQLRRDLEAKGYRFRTDGDGEVLLGLYRFGPDDFASQLDGMFAFALWDGRRRRLVLGRDRCGIKPLYWWTDGHRVVFASELKGVLSCASVPVGVNRDAVADYLAVRFALPPGCTFAGVSKVEPGTLVVADPDGVAVRPFHRLDALALGSVADPPAEPLAALLTQSVASTAEPGRRLGVLLSGGLDSSTVAALGARVAAGGVDSFSVGYDSASWEDETPFAAEVARHVGAAHAVTTLAAGDVAQCFLDTIWYLEEPIYTPVCLSTFAVSRLASASGKWVLAGDGSDELLLGYDHLHAAHRVAEHGGRWRDAYWQALGWLPEDLRPGLLDEDMVGRCAAGPAQARAGIRDALASGAEAADVMRYFEVTKKLPEYHLLRVDRLSMAHALEVRVPYLRNRVTQWALTQRAQGLMAGQPKQDLRDVAREVLPRGLVERPKQKFTAPSPRWLQGPLREIALDLLHDGAGAQALGLRPEGLRSLARDFQRDPASFATVTWGLVVLLAWYRLVYERIGRARARSANRLEPALERG
jgi:asparagine synthase (glutamine-hydrolysing)